MSIRATWVFLQRALLAVGVLMLLGLAILPHLGLYRPVTILSGSMRPTFSPGDMVVVVPEPTSSVRVGQVISYQVPVGIHQVETHRVVKILSGAGAMHPVVRTQGDANNYPDPWIAKLEGATAWHQVAVAPKLGYLVNAFRTPQVRMAAVLIAPLFLLALALSEIWSGSADERDEANLAERPRVPRSGERRVWVGPYKGPERRRGRDRRAARNGHVPLPAPVVSW
ncbi:MAG: signal peptidase I [Solirubrobacteraceae bacterium]